MTSLKLSITAALVFLVSATTFAADFGRYSLTGHATPGGQVVKNSTGSSKFTEFRNLRDGFYLYDLGLDVLDAESGRFVELHSKDLLRDDQNINARIGVFGKVRLGLDWDQTPHRLSNNASTPYMYRGDGLYEVPTTVSGITKALVPTGSQQLANDSVTAGYLSGTSRSTDLGNQRKKGSVSLDYALLENLNFRMGYSNEKRDGNKISYGPIGDRPPRTLGVQLPQPIDYNTHEFKVETDYQASFLQANLAYLYSSFGNNIGSMKWQSIYSSSQATEEPWGGSSPRSVATYGRRALDPSNKYHNATLALGADLPFDSRLAATIGYGFMRQDEALVPYSTIGAADSTGVAWNDPAKLPRTSAEAKIDTMLGNVDYTINPIPRLNLKPFYRFYGLQNNTKTQDWRYVTGDTTNTNGSVSYVNNRRNLALGAYKKQNLGLDTSYGLDFWHSTIGLGFDREVMDHQFREANTRENSYKLTLRSRPLKWVNFRTKVLYGDRGMKDDKYDSQPTRDHYTYSAGQATDSVDPKYSFDNFPDSRLHDVSERKRRQFDFDASVSPLEKLDVSASYNYRKDDFNSHVKPSSPLVDYPGTISAVDRAATTAGQQLGLLETTRNQYGTDVSYAVTDRLTLSAFFNREDNKSKQRGFEFADDNKINPSTVAGSTEQGPWTRSSQQWIVDMRDPTNTLGLGAGFAVIPGKLNFSTQGIVSKGQVEINYSGFGAQSAVTPGTPFADNYQFGFRSPPPVRHDRYTLDATLEYEVLKDLIVSLGYLYERYKNDDWQQANPWSEPVNGVDNFTRDTSQDLRWGNRLVNMGSYLAGGYVAHVASLSMTYKF